MKTVILLILAVGLFWWLCQLSIVLPGIGIIALGWPLALIIVALLYTTVGVAVWLLRRFRAKR